MENPHLYVTACFLCKLLSQCQCQVATNLNSGTRICVTQCHATGLGPGLLNLTLQIQSHLIALILFLGILVGTPLMLSPME